MVLTYVAYSSTLFEIPKLVGREWEPTQGSIYGMTMKAGYMGAGPLRGEVGIIQQCGFNLMMDGNHDEDAKLCLDDK
ncbi:hypothetical protein Taro_013268 [Colocasia esculenta]|uniref:Uncharacterized protein n=1 Tax=Colocasia esculenta TaxID=4460 RepID=A0A843UFG1_COLES|nr:hypothetical protein [Colocasia esculenta]